MDDVKSDDAYDHTMLGIILQVPNGNTYERIGKAMKGEVVQKIEDMRSTTFKKHHCNCWAEKEALTFFWFTW